MGYELSLKSNIKLQGVHPDLVKIVKLAQSKSPYQIIVVEGLRSIERQKQLVAAGASKTMNSRHIDGHAVDLVVAIDGNVRWDWPMADKVAALMKDAAAELKIPLEWGGVWDKYMDAYSSPETETHAYAQRRIALGKKPFIDGPHFQLPFKEYP